MIEKRLLILGFTFFGVSVAVASVTFFFLHSGKTGNSLFDLAVLAQGSCRQSNLPKAQSKEVCYAKFLEKISFEQGGPKAIEVLLQLQKIDEDARGCHFIGHGIGYGMYRRDSENWRNDITSVSGMCSYGIPMGIIEQYIAGLPEGMVTKEFVPTICGPAPRADCNHIVGHLLLADSTVKGDIDKALDLCTSLEGNKTQYNHCLTGVFMEHMTAFNLIEHGYAPESYLNWPARVDTVAQVCRSYDGPQGEACWEELPHMTAVKWNNDYQKVFDFCSTGDTLEEGKRCVYHSIGILAASYGFHIDSAKDMCGATLPASYDFPGACYSRLVASTISSVPHEVPQVVDFCSSLESSFQESCFQQIRNQENEIIRNDSKFLEQP